MTQLDIVSTTAATYCKLEATYGTTPGSMTRIFPRGTVTVDPNVTIIPVDTQQNLLVRRDKSVRGLKTCSAKFQCDSYIDNTRANSAATPAQHWLGAMIKACMGGESMPAGSLVVAASTASVVNVTAAQGTRFPVGQVILVDVANVPEVAIVKSVATDAVSVYPNLSAGPTTSEDVFNTHSYHFTDVNTASLALQLALAQDSSHQWTLNGLTGNISLEITRDARLSYSFDLKGATFTGPSSQAIATTVGTNALSGPVPNRDAVCLLQALTTTTRVHVPFDKISLAIDTGMELVPELGGATEGIVAAMRAGMPTVTADLTLRSDLAQYTTWDNDTDLMLLYAVPRGTGATKQWTGFVLYCNIEARPSRADLGNGREGVNLKLRGRHNTLQSAVVTDLALSPLVIFDG